MTYGTNPWGSGPRQPNKPMAKVSKAYRDAGWDIGPTGKAIPPLNRLAPGAPGFTQLVPNGLSRLPEPNRRWGGDRRRDDRPAPPIPFQVASVSEIPDRLRPLYGPASSGTGYIRNAAGTVLGSYRDQKARDPLAAPMTRRATLTRTEWATLLAVAEPGPEREHFMRDVALKRLTIKD